LLQTGLAALQRRHGKDIFYRYITLKWVARITLPAFLKKWNQKCFFIVYNIGKSKSNAEQNIIKRGGEP
jgi:phage terminase large subunit